MKKTVTIISIIVILIIAAAALVFTGVIDISFLKKTETEVVEDPSACVNYMNTYVLINDQGRVLKTTEDQPQDVTQISGIGLKTMIVGEVIETSNARGFSYAMNVIRELKKNAIRDIGEVFVSSENEITLYMRDADIKILIGKEDKTSEKFGALVNFYESLKAYSGTLNMREVSNGYTLKLNEEEGTTGEIELNEEDTEE